MVIVNIQKFHFMPAYRTKQRIISKRSTNGGTPSVKAEKEMMFFFGYGFIELFIRVTMTGIKTTITDHFEMFFGDEPFDEINGRNCFLDILFIFVAVIMKSNLPAIVMIDFGSSDNKASKISANVFNDSFWVTLIRFSINIKAMFMFRVAKGFNSFKRGLSFC